MGVVLDTSLCPTIMKSTEEEDGVMSVTDWMAFPASGRLKAGNGQLI